MPEISVIATIAIAACSSLTAIVLTVWKMTRVFVTQSDCQRIRDGCDKLRDKDASSVAEDIKEIKKSNSVQYYMLRSLVAHASDLSPEVKARILNAGNGGSDAIQD